MKPASQYPVTFPYGATSKPYSTSKPHLGDDHAAPATTPIDVGDTIIGLVGTTGKSTGNHLHIQKVQNGTVVNPNGQGLANTISFPATVYAVGYNEEIGSHVRIRDAKGVQWSYFHMIKNSQKVKVGQVINKGGENMSTKVDTALNRIIHTEMEGWDFNKTHAGQYDNQLIPAWNGTNVEDMIWSKWNQNGAFRERRQTALNFYDKYSKIIGDLEARPTKQQLEQAISELNTAKQQAEAEAKKTEEANKKAIELQKDKDESMEVGNRFVQWIGSLFKKG